jgi:hypothetical protein
MAAAFRAETREQVVEAVAWAAAEEMPLEVTGRGSKQGLGRPVQAGHGLDLSELSGITLYEPEELILSAHAGTPLWPNASSFWLSSRRTLGRCWATKPTTAPSAERWPATCRARGA